MTDSSAHPRSSHQHSSEETFWKRRARRLALRLSFALWLETFLPALLVVTLLLCAAVVSGIIGRIELRIYLPIAAATGIAVLLYCYSRRFVLEDALTRLDVVLRLNSRLMSAHAGVGSWPPIQHVSDGLSWRWPRIGLPLVLCALALSAARTVPESALNSIAAYQPFAWEEVDEWLDAIEQEKLVDEQGLEELRGELESLRAKPKEEWYEQGTLEASDALRNRVKQELSRLAEESSRAAELLHEAAEAAAHGRRADEHTRKELRQSVEKLTSGTLQSKRGSAQQLLSTVERLDGLSPQELAAAGDQLREAADAFERSYREGTLPDRELARRHLDGKSGGQSPSKDLRPSDQGSEQGGGSQGSGGERRSGNRGNRGNGESNGQTGQGGIARGPGTAPLKIDPKDEVVGDHHRLYVQGQYAPDEDQPYEQSLSFNAPSPAEGLPGGPGNAARFRGEGGTAVWRYAAEPRERQVLKRFFSE